MWQSTEEQTVNGDAHGPNINWLGQVAVFDLVKHFWRLEGGRAVAVVHAVFSGLALHDRREICNLAPVFVRDVCAACLCCEQNVVWLDVSVSKIHFIV